MPRLIFTPCHAAIYDVFFLRAIIIFMLSAATLLIFFFFFYAILLRYAAILPLSLLYAADMP